jgi:esterase/lipase
MDSVPDLPLVNDTSFWRDAHHMNAINDLKEIRIPVFILQGERDYQVTMESYENFMEAMEGKRTLNINHIPNSTIFSMRVKENPIQKNIR